MALLVSIFLTIFSLNSYSMNCLNAVGKVMEQAPFSRRVFNKNNLKAAKLSQSKFLNSHRQILLELRLKSVDIDDIKNQSKIISIIDYLESLSSKLDSAKKVGEYEILMFRLFEATTVFFHLYPKGDFYSGQNKIVSLRTFKDKASNYLGSESNFIGHSFKPIYTFGAKLGQSSFERSGISYRSYINALMQGFFPWELPMEKGFLDGVHMLPAEIVSHDITHVKYINTELKYSSRPLVAKRFKEKKRFWNWLMTKEDELSENELRKLMVFLHFHMFEQGKEFHSKMKFSDLTFSEFLFKGDKFYSSKEIATREEIEILKEWIKKNFDLYNNQ